MTPERADSSDSAAAGSIFSPQAGRRRVASPHSDAAWRFLLLTVTGCVAGAVANLLGDAGSMVFVWGVTALLGLAWVTASRFLVLARRARRVWIFWLAVCVLVIPAFGSSEAGYYIGLSLGALLLVIFFFPFRRQKPYQHLSSARRAGIFFLGVIALVALVPGWFFDTGDRELSWLHAVGIHCLRFALGFLQVFWIFSLLNLFLGMRLHFLRLRPKLAVSALFIALVPLVLVFIFGLVAIYSALGGSGASHGRDMLNHWARLVEEGAELGEIPFGTHFEFHGRDREYRGQDEKPRWLDTFASSLVPPAASADGDSATGGSTTYWTPRDTTAYFRCGNELWLVRVRGIGEDDLRLDGLHLDETALDHLSGLLRANAGFYSSQDLSLSDEELGGDALSAGTETGSLNIRGRYRRSEAAADSSSSLWERPLAYGGALLNVLRLGRGGFRPDEVLFHLQVRLVDLAGGFVQGENQFNLAVVIALAVVAFLFLCLELFALFFGIRITGGITSAVRDLHRGTKRLAAGDLDTRIDLPNEDEFGDLAASFNEMTVAVKRGQDEAVARERLERELQTAREIQERLLPDEVPSVPGFEITGTSVPSRQVGGDYFDFLSQADGKLGVAIGDVSGKGIPAALLMSNLQASLQGQVIHPSSVAEVVARVNDLLVRSTDPHMFATFFYGVLDCPQATFTYTNAGHNPPVLCQAQGAVEFLKHGGLLLGMLPDQEYGQETVSLDPGDVIVLFTDGITEAVGPTAAGPQSATETQAVVEVDAEEEEDEVEDVDAMFGDQALLEVIKASAHLPAAAIKDAILAAVSRHTAGTPQSDDITLVVLKRQGE